MGNLRETPFRQASWRKRDRSDLAEAIESQGFVGMPIAIRHAQAAGALPGPHRDPFDRMLIAQAILDDLVLLSNERAFDAYGVRRLW